MDECIGSLGQARILSTHDTSSVYKQTEIDERDRDKTALTSLHGVHHFVRMPFGLQNGPAAFKRAMDIIISSDKWQ